MLKNQSYFFGKFRYQYQYILPYFILIFLPYVKKYHFCVLIKVKKHSCDIQTPWQFKLYYDLLFLTKFIQTFKKYI